MGHIKAQHAHRNAGLEDRLRRVRIGEHVELCMRGNVAAFGVGPAHHDDL